MTKLKPVILELKAVHDKDTENFYRIKIQSGEARGQVYISKVLGIPKQIIITIQGKEE